MTHFEKFVQSVESRGREYWTDYQAIGFSKNPSTRGHLDLLYRVGCLQIERVIHGAFDVIPLHRHPGVDSYEFPLWGSGELWIGQRRFVLDDTFTPWRPLYVSRATYHGGQAMERGGAFLSVQHWPRGVRGSVVSSWENK